MEGSQWKCWLRMAVFTFLNLACSYQNRLADQAARRNGCWSRYRWSWSPPVGGNRDRTGTAHYPLALCCLQCECHLLECQDHYRKWQLKLQRKTNKHSVTKLHSINGSPWPNILEWFSTSVKIILNNNSRSFNNWTFIRVLFLDQFIYFSSYSWHNYIVFLFHFQV